MRWVIGSILLGASLNLTAATGLPTSVVVQPLSELLQTSQQSAPAEVINEEHTVISARLNATVEELLVQVGDQVKKDQPLLRLLCSDYQLTRAQAESDLSSLQARSRLARQQLTRAERLLKQKNASIELRDQRRSELNSLLAQQQGAKARIEEANLAISRCVPLAPYDGTVTEKMISQGSLVAPGSQLLKLLGADSQEVSAALTHNQLNSLKEGVNLQFRFHGQSYPLRIRTILPLMDNRARTQELRLAFTADKALSGTSGRILWQEAVGKLPVRYIVSRQGKLGVMQSLNGKAQFIPLPHAIEGQAVTVDLPADSLIITEGQHGVASGDEISHATPTTHK